MVIQATDTLSLTLIDLLRQKASEQFDRRVYTFLSDDGTEEASLTYGELDRRARAMAARLQSVASAGERVLLLYPPGLDYITAFFACLYAGTIAVPAYPPRRNRNRLRLEAIVADAQATAALTTTALLDGLAARFDAEPHLAGLRWLTSRDACDGAEDSWRRPDISSDALAFLQYTSGSTSAPKGVMLSHRNLISNERLIQSTFRQTAESVILGWLPLYHDMGLIGNVIQPLHIGAQCILMSPMTFLQRPVRWLEAISRYRATTSGGPNFAYELCVRKISDEQRATLDLSSWDVAFNGAEPIRPETLESFASAFESCGFRREAFYPCYGLAEATLLVSGSGNASRPVLKKVQARALENNSVVDSDPGGGGQPDEAVRTIAGCGSVPDDVKVLIVDPETLNVRRSDQIGEIWVSGSGVAGGYWNRPQETARVFEAYTADTGEGPFLRTGDLGFLQDGLLFVTGRLKDLVIIRGLNYYPQDIELTVEQCSSDFRPGCGAAFSVEVAGEERLAIVQEVDRRRNIDAQALAADICEAVAEVYQLQVHAIAFIKPGTIPKTSSGKIQRHACRAAFLEESLPLLGEWRSHISSAQPEQEPGASDDNSLCEQSIEDWLRAQMAAKLGIAVSDIDLNQSLTRYGLDSLMILELAHAIESGLGASIPVSTMLECRNLIHLADEIRARSTVAATDQIPESQSVAGECPLSMGQQALWFLYQMSRSSPAYNIGGAVRVLSDLNVAALERAFQILINRHHSLRTTFAAVDGVPVQRIHAQSEAYFQKFDASSWSQEFLDNRLVEESQRPFVLEQGPLLRLSLFKRSANEHVFMLMMHHIIGDFWSLAVLIHELGVLYKAECAGATASLEPLASQYGDYVRWQAEMMAGERGERLRAYWRDRLTGVLPVLNLPTKGPRPPAQTYRGRTLPLRLDAETTRRLKSLASGRDATLYMVLLAAYQVLLSRYTGQEDILVGSPIANRNMAALRGTVGYLTNLVVLRADLSDDPLFQDFLEHTRQTALDAFRHQEYPFRLLVEYLEPARDLSRPPLCQVAFVLHKSPAHDMAEVESLAAVEKGKRMQIGGLQIESLALKEQVAPFDITLIMAESEGELIGSLQYNTDLFDEAMISRMAEHFQNILRAVAADSSQRISALPLLTDRERDRILAGWNNTYTPYAQELCLHHLFERQAERVPDGVAVIFEGDSLTYRELNSRSNQLSRYLRARGIGSETPVGICIERSPEMIVALMAVLKAGAAYLPLDSSYPKDRLAFMMKDARVPVLLTQQRLVNQLPDHNAEVILLDRNWPEIALCPDDNFDSGASVDNLAYVIYTSGSTGKPKGAMNAHRGITNRLEWMQEFFHLTEADRVLQKTPLSFDVSVWELFWPLITGATMVVARPGGHQDSAYLVKSIIEQKVTTAHFVPSMLQAFLEEPGVEECAPLKRVICSGEALSVANQERFFQFFKGAGLYNLYGPTEAAVDVTYWECRRDGDKLTVPIGKPIANTQIYILDKDLNPVPAGVHGELHIGGTGVGRGYFNRPELTAEKFIPDPFGRAPGARLYKTGDLSRHLDDGNIEYLGRLDHQVKIRGNRIELEEIEAVLQQHPAVREALVMARSDGGGTTRLVAYVAPDQTQAVRLEGQQLYRLPNGLEIAHLNRNETDFLYKEIFEDCSYLNDSITLRDDDCIFDVGANIGLFTLRAYEQCANAQVYAFEPIPPVFDALRANANLYGLNVKLFNCGLSDKTAQVEFTYYPKASLMSGAYAEAAEDEKVVRAFLSNQDERLAEYADHLVEGRFESVNYRCDLKTVSQVIRENQVDKIDLLKIDVEKSELDVLRGIEPNDWKKIKQIAIEVHDIDGRLELIKDLLEGQGYELVIKQDDLLKNTALYNISAVRRSAVSQRNEPIRAGENGHAGLKLKKSVIDASHLHDYLKQRLPVYMLPSAFVLLEAFPTTPNGKVDRRALPAPGNIKSSLAAGFLAPRTSTERKLAQIWADLLKVAQVGAHDNFFELGGDSILGLQVIARANRAGMRLAPMQIFQCQTVAELAETIGAAQESDRQPAAGPVPLMPAQIRLLEENTDDLNRLHHSVIVNTQEALDAAILRRAVDHLLARHDALRLRFDRIQQTWQQTSAEHKPGEVFTYADLSSMDESERSTAIATTIAAAAGGLNLSEGPLIRVVLINQGRDGGAKLILTVHTLAADDLSCRILLDDLQMIYSQLSSGDEAGLAHYAGSFKQWAARVRQYAGQSEIEASLNYWMESGTNHILRLPLDYSEAADTSGSARAIAASLTVEETRALLGDALTSHRAQLSEALLAATAMGIEEWSQQQTLRLDIEIQGREAITSDLIFSRAVGPFTMTYPLLLKLERAMSPGNALKAIKEQIRRVPQKGVSFGLLRYLGDQQIQQNLATLPEAELKFSFVDQTGDGSKDGVWSALASDLRAPTLSRVATRPYLIEIKASISGGQLQTLWTYSERAHRSATIERLIASFMHSLKELISRPLSNEEAAFSPSDFPLANLDQRQLNKLSAILNKKSASEPGPYEKR